MELKYVIAGAGATGGSIGAFLAADGRNVTFLARGAQLEAFLEKGISMRGTVRRFYGRSCQGHDHGSLS